MPGYFSTLPKTKYSINRDGKFTDVGNIFIRQKLVELVKQDASVYYPYQVKPRERPDIIAYNYYGSVDYTWIVFFSNDIIDPYFEWPLDTNDFNNYIISKYGSISNAKETLQSYQRILRPAVGSIDEVLVEVDLDTYETLDAAEKKSISNYDYEFNKNESHRNIQLIENIYVAQIVGDFKRGLVNVS